MRTKPDLTRFAPLSKDPSAFLDGGAADREVNVVEKPSLKVASPVANTIKPEPTVQKLFRLNWDVALALKVGAAQQSVQSGRRVTETEIVETLIKQYFKLDI